MSQDKLLDKVKLKRPECEFSYLLDLANKNKEKILEEELKMNFSELY